MRSLRSSILGGFRSSRKTDFSDGLGIVNRGSITFWFDEDSIEKWYSTEPSNGPGRPHIYSDQAIRCGLMIKSVFHVALRALQGLIQSLIKILGLDLICPHYKDLAQGSRWNVRRFWASSSQRNDLK